MAPQDRQFIAQNDDLEFLGLGRSEEEANELQTALVDENSGRRLELGSPIEVSVLQLQTARARVDLLPVHV